MYQTDIQRRNTSNRFNPRLEPVQGNPSSIELRTDQFLASIFRQYLDKPYFNVNEEQNHIIISSNLNDVEILSELIQAGFEPQLYDNNLFMVASSKGRLPVLERLLQDPRVNPADRLGEAAKQAYLGKHFHVLKRLLQIPPIVSAIDPDILIVYVRHLESGQPQIGRPIQTRTLQVQPTFRSQKPVGVVRKIRPVPVQPRPQIQVRPQPRPQIQVRPQPRSSEQRPQSRPSFGQPVRPLIRPTSRPFSPRFSPRSSPLPV